MTKPLPSLALEMSQDGIALHQLAFDGHWHELARVGLGDAALRERLSNMRDIAIKLEGRGFRVQVWLPNEQVIAKNLRLGGADSSPIAAQARAEIARLTSGKPRDFTVQIGDKNSEGVHPVAAVRIRTLQEAKAFAKSHGFHARGYSTQAAVTNFPEKPSFAIPVDKAKLVGLSLVAVTAATLVLGGGYAFYKIDPLNMWEIPPKAADFAPFQQPNPGIERASAPAGPAALSNRPGFSPFAPVTAQSGPHVIPYLPPRQLTAVALESVTAPVAPAQGTAPDVRFSGVNIAVNWPAEILPLPAAGIADTPPELGLINALSRIPPLTLPEIGSAPAVPSGQVAKFTSKPRPMTVANTAFFLEPLPAVATRLSQDALAEFVTRSGLTVAQLSRMAQPLLLIESKVVEVTPGLPPILPRLRSGLAVPPQVAPPAQPVTEVEPTPAPITAADAPLFSIVQGPPDIRPAMRPAPVVALPPAEVLPYQIINGAPELRPVFRPEAAPLPPVAPPAEPAATDEPATPNDSQTDATEPAIPAEIAPAEPAVASTAEPQDIASAVDAAIQAVLPAPQETPFALITGQPAQLPLLRSGAAIPPVIGTSAPVEGISPATAEANALRPRRRPQAIIDLPAPIDPMISGAAPATANRASHRNAAFAANAARIAETVSNRPRETAPAVPVDPQTVNLPTSASVARSATIENAINLRQTNLIGIFGTSDARTALIRLSGGRMVRVQQGQSFSGWTVIAISENAVRIKKRNREEILRMPAQ